MVFCNIKSPLGMVHHAVVTILILVDGFLQCQNSNQRIPMGKVTILILVDGFLQ